MARRKRKYGTKNDNRPTLIEALLQYSTFNPRALFALLYVSGLTSSDAYRIAFNRFDLAPSAIACSASRMMRDARVQEYLFNISYAYSYDGLRLNVDFPKVSHRLDWDEFEEKRQKNLDRGLHCEPGKSK